MLRPHLWQKVFTHALLAASGITRLLSSNCGIVCPSTYKMPGLPLPFVTDPTKCLPADSFTHEMFDQRIPLKGIAVPAKNTSTAVRRLGPHLFRHPLIRTVFKDPSNENLRILLFKEDYTGIKEVSELPSDVQETVHQLDGALVSHEVVRTYKSMSTDEVLRTLLPPEITHITESFEHAGHLAHMNLTEDNLPYKYVIGRVILEKNSHLRTVVNKTGKIETTFRTFPMEVIAGEDDTNVTVKMSGATFRFDFKEVYWNSRLQTEHKYIATEAIPAKSVVADMFCGVGPFAIPLATAPQCCAVHANDLNPKSVDALKLNVRKNHVSGLVHPYNMDARDFIRELVQVKHIPFTHALMNLPADGIEFLDVFVGVYAHSSLPMPTIHCYCFSKAETFEVAVLDVHDRVLTILGLPNPIPPEVERTEEVLKANADSLRDATQKHIPGFNVREIRDVAPKKIMCCAEFVLPEHVAKREGAVEAADADATAPVAKRARIEE